MPDIFVDKELIAEEETQKHPVDPDSHAVQSVQNLLRKEKYIVKLLSAYTVHPEGISFVNQEPDEVVVLFLRRHFVTNVPWLLGTTALLLVPPIIFALSSLPAFSLSIIPAGLTISATAFYYLLVVTYAFSNFISWFYNVGIVTQKRLIDLDSTNILNHNTAAALFSEIVDVKFTQQGFFQSYFDYGDVHIQIEAIHANFEFFAAPKPAAVLDIISDLRVATKGGRKRAAIS